MNRAYLLAAAGAGSVFVVVAALALLHLMRREARFAARVQLTRGIVVGSSKETQKAAMRRTWLQVIALFGRFIRGTGMLSAGTRTELEETLAAAGLRGASGLDLFIGAKILLLFFLPVAAWLAMRDMQLPSPLGYLLPAGGGVIGLLTPDTVVRVWRKRYLKRVERGLPDALDMLVICSQAGLGMGASVVRVAEEMAISHPDIAQELSLTANELQIMADSRVALGNLGSRTGLDGLKRLATTLVQSMQFGTPLSDAMRQLSAEMRTEMLTRYEAKASKLSVMLTMPMVVFILPCVFLVVGGPAVVQVSHLWGN